MLYLKPDLNFPSFIAPSSMLESIDVNTNVIKEILVKNSIDIVSLFDKEENPKPGSCHKLMVLMLSMKCSDIAKSKGMPNKIINRIKRTYDFVVVFNSFFREFVCDMSVDNSSSK